MDKSNFKLGIVFALLAIAMFSIMNAVIKGIETEYSPVQVAFIRFFISIIPCFGFYYFEKDRPKLFISTKLTLQHFIRGGVSALSITALCAAFKLLPFGDATAINFSSILFITALSVPILGQRVDLPRWVAVFVGFTGILIIAQPGGDIFCMGAVYALFYSLTDAYVIIMGRVLSDKHSPGASALLLCLSASLVSGMIACFYWQMPSVHDSLILVALGLFGGVGFLLQTMAYNFAPASAVAPMAYSGMIWGVVFGFVFWNEIPDLSLILGYVLIVGSGYYIIRKESKPKV